MGSCDFQDDMYAFYVVSNKVLLTTCYGFIYFIGGRPEVSMMQRWGQRAA